jgi:hypothetical protein
MRPVAFWITDDGYFYDYTTRKAALYADLVSYENLHPEVTRRVEPLTKAALEALAQFTQGVSEEQKRDWVKCPDALNHCKPTNTRDCKLTVGFHVPLSSGTTAYS